MTRMFGTLLGFAGALITSAAVSAGRCSFEVSGTGSAKVREIELGRRSLLRSCYRSIAEREGRAFRLAAMKKDLIVAGLLLVVTVARADGPVVGWGYRSWVPAAVNGIAGTASALSAGAGGGGACAIQSGTGAVVCWPALPASVDSVPASVGDLCDNCMTVANPRLPPDFISAHPWATLTGGQRDDDGDGYGNRCDAKFTAGRLVGSSDLAEFRASNGKAVSAHTCGTSGARPCAIFDLDEVSDLIGSGDLSRFRALNGHPPGPKCPACPLAD